MPKSSRDILISVENQYVEKMLDGTKMVELRRRVLSLEEGSHVWIYSKIPTGRLMACGIVEHVFKAAPIDIWDHYGDVSGVTKAEFDTYFDAVECGCAIVFSSVSELHNKISLKSIRDVLGDFHPPQFFKNLSSGSPELKLFRNCSA